MQVHVARIGLFTVDTNGQRINKNDPGTTIGQVLATSSEMLVIPDAAISSSTNYPTIKKYLEDEAAAGFMLQHLDQTFVITYKQ